MIKLETSKDHADNITIITKIVTLLVTVFEIAMVIATFGGPVPENAILNLAGLILGLMTYLWLTLRDNLPRTGPALLSGMLITLATTVGYWSFVMPRVDVQERLSDYITVLIILGLLALFTYVKPKSTPR